MPCRRRSSRSASEMFPAAGKRTWLTVPACWPAGVCPGRSPGKCGVGASLMSFPLEVAPVPGPDQALGEEENEDQHGEQGAGGQAGERDGERQEEQHLDVEDQEEDRIQVIVGLELDPRVTGGFEAAFIGGVLARA